MDHETCPDARRDTPVELEGSRVPWGAWAPEAKPSESPTALDQAPTVTAEEPHRVSRTLRGACRVGNEVLDAVLHGRWGIDGPPEPPSGGGSKPPHAALAEDRRGER